MGTRSADYPIARVEKGFGLRTLVAACALVAAVAVAAVPAVIASRQAANAAAALAYIKTWRAGQEDYRKAYGVYAPNDDILVSQGFIREEVMPDGVYRFVVDTADASSWSGRAEPAEPLDGVAYFYADESGLVTRSKGCSADRYDPPAE